MLSLTLSATRNSGLGKILEDRMKSHPQSEHRKQVDAALKQIDKTNKKRIPNDRHEKRIKAHYVDPISETKWNRPVMISATEAYEDLQDAVNDYSGRYDQGYITPGDMLRHVDVNLYRALQQWPDRPILVPPEHPQWPSSH
jgi:hypothetical protein